MVLAGVGILISLIATFTVRTKEGGDPGAALHRGAFSAAGVMMLAIFGISRWLLDGTYVIAGVTFDAMGVFLATVAGLAGGVAIGLITEHYTSESRKPAQEIAKDSLTARRPTSSRVSRSACARRRCRRSSWWRSSSHFLRQRGALRHRASRRSACSPQPVFSWRLMLTVRSLTTRAASAEMSRSLSPEVRVIAYRQAGRGRQYYGSDRQGLRHRLRGANSTFVVRSVSRRSSACEIIDIS